ncbi:MAG TPA: chorismate-binding protein [Candidatus Binatia bacterium]|nr:chorismate-binding protein [Candidatus Binatia bacterium]
MTAPDASVRPGLDEAQRLAQDHELIALVRSSPAGDVSGPRMLAALPDVPGAFLFESATGEGEFARFTFAGLAGPERFRVRRGRLTRLGEGEPAAPVPCPDPLRALREFTEGPRVALPAGLDVPFTGGSVGYLAYEAVSSFERIPRSGADPLDLPDAWWGRCLSCSVLDRERQVVHHITHIPTDERLEPARAAGVRRLELMAARLETTGSPAAPPLPVATAALPETAANLSRAGFTAAVQRCLAHIAAGDIFQVQISRRFSLDFPFSPVALYAALREANPSPYLFYLRTDECALVGTSPEMLVRVATDGRVDYHPIAGTRRRGRSPAEDAAMESELRSSEKEQAEHLMLVDLGRNDVGRVSEIGSVQVDDYAAVRRYANVMHLETSIRGRLRAGLTATDALRACFPAGTVTGAPKVRAMEIIAALEPEVRGAYAGAVGYLDFRGSLDTAIALRTAVLQGGRLHLQAAAGIVADSDPAQEALEIDNKLRALVRAAEAVRATGASSTNPSGPGPAVQEGRP